MGKQIQNKESIIELIRSNHTVFEQFGIVKIGLFGSFVRNEQTNHSDIDLIVEFEKGKKSYSSFFSLSEYLETLFNHKVDLLTEKGISRHLKSSIDKETIYVTFNH
ncbi:MAG: nucleotidyltransferase family protein [Bacteroidales bacterium]|nr:nucleotidyltransferase family protein [Bacteroidales bacterium]